MIISYSVTPYFDHDLVAVTIKGKAIAEVGETVILEGLTEFRPSVVHLKWQKYLDGEYVDIDIHKSKYQGTKNSIRSPKLVLNNLDLEDGGYYRIKFTCTSSVEYSSVHRLRIQPKEGKSSNRIEILIFVLLLIMTSTKQHHNNFKPLPTTCTCINIS